MLAISRRASTRMTVISRAASSIVNEQSGKHLPFGDEGTGYYSLATRGCFDVIQNAIPQLLGATDRAIDAYKTRQDGSPFVIADYGTADAGTSLPAIKAAVERVRAELPTTAITVIYEDQITNDFRSVFYHAHGLIEPAGSIAEDGSQVETYMKETDNVFVLASGTTFYQQVVPHASVDVGFSATAMHWLTNTPCKIPDALHSACTHNAPAKAAFEQQAAKDWLTIMTHRVAELKKGGAFVCVNFAIDEQGQFLGTTNQTPSKMHDNFAASWQSMVDDGAITQSEWLNTNFPNQYRRIDEVVAPFEGSNPAIGDAELAKVTTDVVPCPYRAAWLATPGDAEEYAQLFMPTTRTWSNSTFAAGLDETRSPEEKDALVEEMYQRYAHQIAQEPSHHGMDYVHTYTTLFKQ
eukprot:TRINITY_DN21368_c0_g1_i1.p1 TRINITY_DN21368_c0_g1~~TRINITY_DN21368_c0_g1_i1.p1  ORF type:complete len:408 (+),score=82.33 TRINITY_DN21368_c0_g1_i1:213-1436(+)